MLAGSHGVAEVPTLRIMRCNLFHNFTMEEVLP